MALAFSQRLGVDAYGESEGSSRGEYLEIFWLRSTGILPSFVRFLVGVASPPVESVGSILWTGV